MVPSGESRAAWDEGRLALLAARGRPDLLPELPAGRWYDAGWRRLCVRRAAVAAAPLRRLLPPHIQADVAFWSGVRAAATRREWRRLTGSSYVVLCYHRTAGLALPGQQRMDVTPAALHRQLLLLRLLGWTPLQPAELVKFHDDPTAVLRRRRYVLTADDGFAEAVAAMTSHGDRHPQVFAVTEAVGGRGYWLGDAELAGWPELQSVQEAGGLVGSHARHHRPLDALTEDAIADELHGSWGDLRERLAPPIAALAYPHGRHDARVRRIAREAGYAFAYSTAQGRNGAGTDRWALRRVEPKMWDTTLSFVWKVLTAKSPPGRWEGRLVRRWHRKTGHRHEDGSSPPGGV